MHIAIMAGPDAGKRVVLTQSPITFGRAAGNTIVLDLPHISREHGELRYADGRWMLVNHSANGTKLGGKLVTARPREIDGEQVVAIGDDAVLQLSPQREEAPPANTGPAKTEVGAKHGTLLSGRRRLWMGIGVFWVLCIGLILFFGTLKSWKAEQGNSPAAELSAEQIGEEIRAPLSKKPVDARRVAEYLRDASESFAMVETGPGALFRTYDAYRHALSYTGGATFEDPLDQRRFEVVQQQLIEQVLQEYRAGYNLLRSGHYEAAADVFRRLSERYPAGSESMVFNHIQKQWATAQRQSPRRR
jgi:pSer/pThr/pTyr-binding forkhead associated (FHA) protein